ncbi:ERV/ALR sulfhydryl oxidase domain-containing protein [Dunaliella salina]|uniref:Sulfhydryl oxidase n=1 Tax=Dunaliella salina TaxID=3046 RepID=A0ABQ7G9H7_DUNSA|nr:ERV/ALR sulfhydryl oxidase domain-containing protein [Dunaliella salina]|eukprot:KAF5831263.1 ERV/ALR sulfhydryl oxidase domain-containing protein [Dunaliella salina]
MRNMIDAVAEFYPCSFCRAHFQSEVDPNPPDTSSNSSLSLWLCDMHNKVNERLGKPLFDCSKALQRWRDGPPDGSCD